jgi:phage baseplate assembly protein W
MSAKIFELLFAEVAVQIAQQVDIEVITGLHRFDPRLAVLSTKH